VTAEIDVYFLSHLKITSWRAHSTNTECTRDPTQEAAESGVFLVPIKQTQVGMPRARVICLGSPAPRFALNVKPVEVILVGMRRQLPTYLS